MTTTTETPAAEPVPDKFLSAEEILGAEDRPWQVVDVPEWRGKVRVRMLSTAEQEAFQKSMIRFDGPKPTVMMDRVQARYLSLCLCDDKGERLFDETAVDKLAKKSHAAVKRIYEAAQRINGVRRQDLEDLAKNFGTTISVSSLSA